ncbi:hypothetical protein TEQG_01013 [Trichophyton equinum CBS 127.97]|uniref:Uncharacterized protein n=1 Tax=Trichophyton equinum (strain ATCC MYA-4606 / CBS 127.97) TaxID=559882 RepID=F2PJA5_TRIEC|nr:hypothetical protein TEQG_01013 [Trichophyton equinum CBS 127.97]
MTLETQESDTEDNLTLLSSEALFGLGKALPNNNFVSHIPKIPTAWNGHWKNRSCMFHIRWFFCPRISPGEKVCKSRYTVTNIHSGHTMNYKKSAGAFGRQCNKRELK